MILPLGDEPNPRGVPVVTFALILANVAAFAVFAVPLSLVRPDVTDPALREYLQLVFEHAPPGVSLRDVLNRISAYDLFVFTHGYRPAQPHVVELFTAMFLHSGFAHLAGNMLFLWIYGDNVEHRIGHAAYLFWYLATGVAATLFYTAFAGASPLPLVGASGAISGVLGFYFLWFPRNRVRLWLFFPFPYIMLAPARLVLGIYLVLDNVLPFLAAPGAGRGVAYGAHIGGFLAGLVAAWVIDRHALAGRPAEFRRAAAPAAPLSTAEAIAGAIDRHRLDEAAEIYFGLPADRTRHLLDWKDSLALADWLAAHGYTRAALIVYQRHLRDHPIGPTAAEAHAGAGLLQLRAFGQATAAYQHLVEALELDPSPDTEALVRAALAEIAALQKFRVPTRPRR